MNFSGKVLNNGIHFLMYSTLFSSFFPKEMGLGHLVYLKSCDVHDDFCQLKLLILQSASINLSSKYAAPASQCCQRAPYAVNSFHVYIKDLEFELN